MRITDCKIFRLRGDARRYAARRGYTQDITRHCKQDYTVCKCGDTEVMVFDRAMRKVVPGDILYIGICKSCGE